MYRTGNPVLGKAQRDALGALMERHGYTREFRAQQSGIGRIMMQELAGIYEQLFAREQPLQSAHLLSGVPLEAARRHFVDCLFDEALAREDVFRTYRTMEGEHGTDGLVLKFVRGKRIGSGLDEHLVPEYDEVAHYQFLAFPGRHTLFGDMWASPWFPNYLMLRDGANGQVALYRFGNPWSSGAAAGIGANNELAVHGTYAGDYDKKLHRINRVEKVTREALCSPLSEARCINDTLRPSRTVVPLFDHWYTGFQDFTEQALEKGARMKSAMSAEELATRYDALRAAVGEGA